MSETTHTPTPWRFTIGDSFSAKDFIIERESTNGAGHSWVIIRHDIGQYRDIDHEKADFEFIVRAVNCHEELLAVLNRILSNPNAQIGGDIRAEAVAAVRKAEASIHQRDVHCK